MTDRPRKLDVASVRDAWNHAADTYTASQVAGRDHYRDEFFGPAQVAICGAVQGLRLLDVGCGNGYFAREMARRGARVTAVDLSPRMIEHARRLEASSPLGISYHVADAAEVDTSLGEFDMATSCMALQDMPEPARVLAAVHHMLRPGARLVASITHPCTNMPYRRWERDASGAKRWLGVDRYFDREVVEYRWDWGDGFTTAAQHAPLEDWFAWILDARFTLRGFHEPRPTEDALRRRPDLEDASRVPYYVVFDLVRPEF